MSSRSQLARLASVSLGRRLVAEHGESQGMRSNSAFSLTLRPSTSWREWVWAAASNTVSQQGNTAQRGVKLAITFMCRQGVAEVHIRCAAPNPSPQQIVLDAVGWTGAGSRLVLMRSQRASPFMHWAAGIATLTTRCCARRIAPLDGRRRFRSSKARIAARTCFNAFIDRDALDASLATST